MKKQWVKDLNLGDKVDSVFLIHSVEKKQKRDGDWFASLRLGDKSGIIAAVMWEAIGQFLNDETVADDFISVKGTLEFDSYLKAPRITISGAVKIAEDQIELEDFFPHTPFPVEELQKSLQEYINSVKDTHLKELLNRIFKREDIYEDFCRAPSAYSRHQAYIGGLLEHTVMVVKNAIAIAQNYDDYNQDLLVTGALLHDLGKIFEFDYRRGIRVTDKGRLVGHLVMGLQMIEKEIDQIEGFPDNLRVLLQHMLISHHGMMEWGSPREPVTMEALILFYADYIDARLSTYREVREKAREKGETWQYDKTFERFLFTGFQEEQEGPPAD